MNYLLGSLLGILIVINQFILFLSIHEKNYAAVSDALIALLICIFGLAITLNN